MCNGALMDLGVYAVNIMVDLFGAPQKVNADAIRLENGLDGVLTATCTYPGMLATVFTSKVADSSGLSEIQGEEGLMLHRKLQHAQQCHHHLQHAPKRAGKKRGAAPAGRPLWGGYEV